jgi:hypothetical protein
LLRKSILDKASGTCDGWLHCNIQVVCHPIVQIISSIINNLYELLKAWGGTAIADLKQLA